MAVIDKITCKGCGGTPGFSGSIDEHGFCSGQCYRAYNAGFTEGYFRKEKALEMTSGQGKDKS